MIRVVVLAMTLLSSAPAFGQSFSCRMGTTPACLDFGDTVCSSRGKCVNQDAACFDSYQCDYQGFTCRSNMTECVEDFESLQDRHNELVRDYNDLLDDAKRMESEAQDAALCVQWASTLAEAQSCY